MRLYTKFLQWLGLRSRCCNAKMYDDPADWKHRNWCSDCRKQS